MFWLTAKEQWEVIRECWVGEELIVSKIAEEIAKAQLIKFHKWQTEICDGFCGIDRHDKCEVIEDGEIKESPYRIPRMDCYKCQKIVRRELGL